MPAPSPVLFSQPHAPRCSMFSNTVSASEIILWLLFPLMFATKPLPHASCSKEGSYNPAILFSFIHNSLCLFYKKIIGRSNRYKITKQNLSIIDDFQILHSHD